MAWDFLGAPKPRPSPLRTPTPEKEVIKQADRIVVPPPYQWPEGMGSKTIGVSEPSVGQSTNRGESVPSAGLSRDQRIRTQNLILDVEPIDLTLSESSDDLNSDYASPPQLASPFDETLEEYFSDTSSLSGRLRLLVQKQGLQLGVGELSPTLWDSGSEDEIHESGCEADQHHQEFSSDNAASTAGDIQPGLSNDAAVELGTPIAHEHYPHSCPTDPDNLAMAITVKQTSTATRSSSLPNEAERDAVIDVAQWPRSNTIGAEHRVLAHPPTPKPVDKSSERLAAFEARRREHEMKFILEELKHAEQRQHTATAALNEHGARRAAKCRRIGTEESDAQKAMNAAIAQAKTSFAATQARLKAELDALNSDDVKEDEITRVAADDAREEVMMLKRKLQDT